MECEPKRFPFSFDPAIFPHLIFIYQSLFVQNISYNKESEISITKFYNFEIFHILHILP